MNNSIEQFIHDNKQNQDVVHNIYNVNDVSYNIMYVIELVDIRRFNYEIKPFITNDNYRNLKEKFLGLCNVITDISQSNLEYLLYIGKILVFFDDVYYYFEYANFAKRAIAPSYLDPEDPMAAHDGLIEELNTNITLIKKRLKTSELKTDKYQLGLFTKTDCAVLYLKSFYNKLSLEKTVSNLLTLDQKAIVSINDINILYQDSSLVPLVYNTSSPEIITDALLKGRIVILLDNSCVACILPATFSTYTVSKAYINTPKYYNIFNHIFITVFFFIAMFLMGLFISIINFHSGTLSVSLLANIKITERGTSWSMFFEVLIVYFLFEFYRFATSRSPNNYIQNIIIILGGLFIGQNAIESGTIGATVLFLTSISYIAVFAVTNNIYLITSINLFRLFILILSYTMGILGFIISSLMTIIYLYKPNKNSNYYLYPFIPFNLKDFKNFFVPNNIPKVVNQ